MDVWSSKTGRPAHRIMLPEPAGFRWGNERKETRTRHAHPIREIARGRLLRLLHVRRPRAQASHRTKRSSRARLPHTHEEKVEVTPSPKQKGDGQPVMPAGQGSTLPHAALLFPATVSVCAGQNRAKLSGQNPTRQTDGLSPELT